MLWRAERDRRTERFPNNNLAGLAVWIDLFGAEEVAAEKEEDAAPVQGGFQLRDLCPPA